MGCAEKSISVASYRYRDVVGLSSGRVDVLAASESLAIQPTTKNEAPNIETQAKRRLTITTKIGAVEKREVEPRPVPRVLFA
jgi:hypothetical protein